jgi:NAD(P)H dehydrogenase (quinone)
MSNDTPILVTGVAGNVGSVGRSVIKLLRERDLPVRALVHGLDERSQALSEMGAELVVADLTNGADVVRALRGCKRMYFGMSISPPYLQATAIVVSSHLVLFLDKPKVWFDYMQITNYSTVNRLDIEINEHVG